MGSTSFVCSIRETEFLCMRAHISLPLKKYSYLPIFLLQWTRSKIVYNFFFRILIFEIYSRVSIWLHVNETLKFGISQNLNKCLDWNCSPIFFSRFMSLLFHIKTSSNYWIGSIWFQRLLHIYMFHKSKISLENQMCKTHTVISKWNSDIRSSSL